MNTLADHAKRIAALEAKVNNVLQEGKVIAVRADDNLLDVEVRGVPLEKVPYLTWRAGPDGKSYWVPEVGESGLLLCPDGQAGNAVFLPALNTSRNEAPESDPNIIKFDFGNDREITIDGSKTEIKHTDGTIIVKVGTTELEVSPTQIKGKIAGIGKILVTDALANINGATFTNGVTNMSNPAGPVVYTPGPIP